MYFIPNAKSNLNEHINLLYLVLGKTSMFMYTEKNVYMSLLNLWTALYLASQLN